MFATSHNTEPMIRTLILVLAVSLCDGCSIFHHQTEDEQGLESRLKIEMNAKNQDVLKPVPIQSANFSSSLQLESLTLRRYRVWLRNQVSIGENSQKFADEVLKQAQFLDSQRVILWKKYRGQEVAASNFQIFVGPEIPKDRNLLSIPYYIEDPIIAPDKEE